jgi:hypothetical protein
MLAILQHRLAIIQVLCPNLGQPTQRLYLDLQQPAKQLFLQELHYLNSMDLQYLFLLNWFGLIVLEY